MSQIQLMMITNNVDIAAHAVASGINRIFVDMETIGKEARQGHLNTHRASHTPDDVQALRMALPDAEILTRINPLYDYSVLEVNDVIRAGTDHIMLPMFTSAEEVETFLDLVDDRARTTLLLETPQSLTRLEAILEHHERIDEIHIGLNDLHLAMGLDFMFELLAGGLIDYLSETIRRKGILFGVGGISSIGGAGSVPADLIMSEHVRLESSAVILSRAFHGGARTLSELHAHVDLPLAVQQLRECESACRALTSTELRRNHLKLQKYVYLATQQCKARVQEKPHHESPVLTTT